MPPAVSRTELPAATADAAGLPRNLLFWMLFALAVAAAWCGLLAMSLGHAGPLRELGPGMGAFERLRWFGEICKVATHGQGWPSLWGMWSVMVLAMMGPVAVPALVAYARLPGGGRTPGASLRLACLGLGYLSVWVVYSALAALLQAELGQVDVLDGGGLLRSAGAGALLLAAAIIAISAIGSTFQCGAA